ncbi:sugar phosphate isomerase/epimerase [Paenibacillus oenotherae]|uniref:Sugar phosphate isomerase/epimerase n=1 Tax=Paenibacillus oenotherae TaxID=1435645 RepID=A0ABS7D969_9BACL|nr:sugar phosphate isomerase/epimerase family protein [Paenibacillus oenotherae]MBW7476492.1 sugar phosphate isomerase/epimerase [Paenibacillus oenotherae]
MNYYMCSISFRHEIVSLEELISFAGRVGFQGIELWGVHARSLMYSTLSHPEALAGLIAERDLKINMISDYVAFTPEEIKGRCKEWVTMSELFHTDKIRIFAGNCPSAGISRELWQERVEQLRAITRYLEAHGISPVIETHPNTLADTLESTLRLIHEVDEPALKVNLDVLHLWETDTPPLEAFDRLAPWIGNVHLKNIDDRSCLSVFEPGNIYSPFGTRDGIVGLQDGLIDYVEVIDHLVKIGFTEHASIEWFGQKPFHYVEQEFRWLKETESRASKLVSTQT